MITSRSHHQQACLIGKGGCKGAIGSKHNGDGKDSWVNANLGTNMKANRGEKNGAGLGADDILHQGNHQEECA